MQENVYEQEPVVIKDSARILRENYLLAAYTILKSGMFKLCELSWYNDDGTDFIRRYLTDRSLILSFRHFCRLNRKYCGYGFRCIGALSRLDKEQVILSVIFGKDTFDIETNMMMNLSDTNGDKLARAQKIKEELFVRMKGKRKARRMPHVLVS